MNRTSPLLRSAGLLPRGAWLGLRCWSFMLLATFLVAGTARARGDFREVIAAVSEVKGEAWAAFRDRHGDRGEIWPSGGAHAKRLAPARAGHCGGEPVEPRIAANKGLQKLATRALTLLNTKT